MININTSRWESVRLLFDKRIMGVNLKSNYGCQLTVSGSEASAADSAAADLGPRQKQGRSNSGGHRITWDRHRFVHGCRLL